MHAGEELVEELAIPGRLEKRVGEALESANTWHAVDGEPPYARTA